MKIRLALVMMLCAGASRAAYLRPGFDAISGGLLFPLAGGLDSTQAAFIVPAIVHRAADGYLIVPGVDWNLLDLGYAAPTQGDSNLLHGSLAIGPSLHLGEPIKDALRAACRVAIHGWSEPGKFGALKAAFGPGGEGVYLNAGTSFVYNMATKRGGLMGAVTLNRKFGQ